MALAMLVAIGLCGPPARAATFVVSSTADSGVGTLRQAILDANVAADADTIVFAVADPGIPQISPATALPAITSPVVIDASTQSPAGRVELTGATATGFTLSGSTITIRGFVINGFTSAGIQIAAGGDDVIEGNFIGTNAAGTASASPASANGIVLSGVGGVRIGGWSDTARNLISGNGVGIAISSSAATENLVVGNWIGTDVTGLAALPNASAGITSFLSSATVVGGTAAGSGNVIAGNGNDGIAISGSNWTVQGNLVGLGADGVTAIPNGRHGIRLFNGTTNTLVGGAGPNQVAYNKSAGILVAVNAGTGNTLRGNAIFDNGALGIDINGTGVAVNDAGDGDIGANLGQNYPVLDPSFSGGASVDGILDSTPLTSFTIELFATPACDASGHGEGPEQVGSLVVATDALGQAAFTASLSRTIGPTEFVTATATDSNGNTSEFSACAPRILPATSTSTSSSTSTSTLAAPSTTTSSMPGPTTTTSTVPPPPSTTSSTAPDPSTTTTTDTLGTTSTSSSTSSSSSVPDTSSSTTTLAPLPTTSTTAPNQPSTTSSTSPSDASTTTSSSTTTSTTQVPPTTLPPDTTTSTTEPPTTSTTLASTTSSSSTTSTTGPAHTTSTTTAPSTSTTSSTDPLETTTSTSSSTTTVTGPTTTSSTTTLPSTSTTSSTIVTTSSTTSTSHAITTTTLASTTSTTSTPGSTTTTTTEPPCTGPDCPRGCGSDLGFVPLRCRLTSLTSAVDGEPALAAMRDGLDRHLRKGETFLDRAESRCGAGRKGPARRSLRMMRQRLARIGKAMHAKPVRRTMAPAVTDPIMRAAAALASDVRTFAGRLTCP